VSALFKEWHTKILEDLHATAVPRYASSNARTLGVRKLQNHLHRYFWHFWHFRNTKTYWSEIDILFYIMTLAKNLLLPFDNKLEIRCFSFYYFRCAENKKSQAKYHNT
jgi:hypothetical protein